MTHHVFEVDGADAKKRAHPDARLGHRPPHPVHAHQAPRQEARQAADRRRASPPSTCTATSRSRSATATSPRSAPATCSVLVATDVAARGVHVDDVELVVHVDPPTEHKAYLHRSGRTARAGSEGDVVTLVLPDPGARTSPQLLRKAAHHGRRRSASPPTSAAVTALVGEVAAYVKPAPRDARSARAHRAVQGGRTGGGARRTHGGGSQGANAQRKRADRDGAASGARSRRARGRITELLQHDQRRRPLVRPHRLGAQRRPFRLAHSRAQRRTAHGRRRSRRLPAAASSACRRAAAVARGR